MDPLRGIVFDLDGTLVDSALDFRQMRREMGLSPDAPILEAIARLPDAQAQRCRAILDRHEQHGAARATLMPGAREFLQEVDRRGLHRAVLTRNARHLALAVLDRLQIPFELVLAREDAPAKPDPAALQMVCRHWQVEPDEVLMLGDFHFDIATGRAAGTRTALFTAGRTRAELPDWAAEADFFVSSFHEAAELLRRLS